MPVDSWEVWDREDFNEEEREVLQALEQWAREPTEDVEVPPEFYGRVMEAIQREPVPPSVFEPSPQELAVPAAAKVTPLPQTRNGHTGRKAMPTWVQQWTPAITMAALMVLAFAFWVNRPFAPEWARRPSGIERSMERGPTIDQKAGNTLHELIQEGIQKELEGNKTEAANAYREAVEQIAFPLHKLAWLAYQQGEVDKGLSQARLAVQLQPEDPAYLDTLAVILCTIGKREEAIHTMEKAVQLQTVSQEDKARLAQKLVRYHQGTCH